MKRRDSSVGWYGSNGERSASHTLYGVAICELYAKTFRLLLVHSGDCMPLLKRPIGLGIVKLEIKNSVSKVFKSKIVNYQ